ncbi:rod-binding protein [Desulfofustis limnaeus]|jgi:flagellar protein FlgJ|uniref:Flagellar rod-binding protein FlgJ n=1 Tax=Desulfofustis limnaeus TaxID=2740163 RepID=A0ABM7W8W7_9BACT|nr:rod-binding protein [Desulfofustis limnaeus]MDX9897221.1 rod-binding protein [Desulfofustis sp.]BDD87358.1 flagellar rod-binding protein FlgJ [Desulfofustis limnaeus]
MNLTPIDPRTLLSASRPTLNAQQKQQRSLQELREYTREFEALFVNELFKAMRKTVPESELFEKGMATEMYEEALDLELARSASAGQGIGLGEAMFEQLRHLVENRRL